ncbi:MAG: sensor histidine kinase [Cytophagia bacterium]|nr:sensor histidine kinase [Cytophagia bacterium]
MRSFAILLLSYFLIIEPHVSYSQETNESLNQELRIDQTEANQILSDLNKAIDLTNYGDYREADKYFQKLDSSQLIISNDSIRMVMLESRSFMNKVRKRYNKSLEDLLEMLNYFTDKKDFNNIAKTQTLLSEFYRARGLKDLAFKHLQSAEKLIETEYVDPCNIAYWFSRRAAYETQFQPNTSNIIFFCQKGLELSGSDCTKYTEALIYNELGFTYQHSESDNDEKVISQYKKSLEILTEANRMRDAATIRHNLATYYTRKGYLDLALEELNPVIELAEKNEWHGSLEDLYIQKMFILSSYGLYKEAYDLSRKAYNSKIELMNDQYAIDVEELQAVHDRELAEEALEQAEIRAKNNEKVLLYWILGASLFGVSTLTVIILFFRVRGKNELLNKQQKDIEKSNQQLSNSLHEKEVLYKELNHRVKNNLMVLSGLIYLQQNSDPSPENEELYKALRNRIQTMAIVHEKLYSIDSSTNINFQDYLEELVPLIYNSLKKGDAIMPYTIRCMTLFLPIDKAIPLALIFNELITNSIKHAGTDTLEQGILIEGNTDHGTTRIIYQDSGKGIPKDFDISKSKSMGMKIVNLMTQQLRAKLDYQSDKQGLKFTIQFD